MTNKFIAKNISRSYSEIIPYHPYGPKDSGWRDGMVTGNGEQGAVCSCSPYTETIIYQNMFFIMPSCQPRLVPREVGSELHEARQAVINFDDSWNVHNRERSTLYCFHPGHLLRLRIPKNPLLSYCRETDYGTAEITASYSDRLGFWTRKTFTSRSDDVTITRIAKSDRGSKIFMDISIDDLSSMKGYGGGFFNSGQKSDEEKIQYKKLVDADCSSIALVVHYPSYEGSELLEGGYAGVTKLITRGGIREFIRGKDSEETINVGDPKNPAIRIAGAEEVILISKTARTHHMGGLDHFAAANEYDIVQELMAATDTVAAKYRDQNGRFSYDAALAPHKEKHSALFHSVSFRLGSDAGGRQTACEDLIKKQKASGNLVEELVERVYLQGRYAQICCAGYSAPRLCGIWTGEWNPGWNGAYTMDANVNIQVSGMNTGTMYDAAIGYIYFVLRQLKDWEENAAMVYGMKDALLIPVNTDGDRAVMVEYDQYYPFQYWNAGASWMILPIFEFWQCFGNREIPVGRAISHLYDQEYLDLEREILLPLLTKQAHFWEQLCTPEYYTDIHGKACYQKGKHDLQEGEKYIIIPSYSPENKPKGSRSAITANATMDISAARDGLKMLLSVGKTLRSGEFEGDTKKWERLLSRLPEYSFDQSGALREWAMAEYVENNEHRHISHLYCAWPAHETQRNIGLAAACKAAIANRNRENKGKDDTASHGWVHKALVAARLKDGESAYALLHSVMSSDIFFTSLMTDHNTDRGAGVYCTDTSIGMVGIINEMLLYSNSGEIQLLPALPVDWKRGSINGLMTRTNARVTKLEWDIREGWVTASIHSSKAQKIKIRCLDGRGRFIVPEIETCSDSEAIDFKQDEEIKVIYTTGKGFELGVKSVPIASRLTAGYPLPILPQ